MTRSKKSRAVSAAEAARNNPYVQRIAEDPELRNDIQEAVDIARRAYGRLSNGKPAAQALMKDKKLQKELKEAATSFRDVGAALQKPAKRKRRKGAGRLIFVALVGGTMALVLNEGARGKVLDALFGKEEEFEYTSTTTAAPNAAPTPA
jgi:hypothetical protein